MDSYIVVKNINGKTKLITTTEVTIVLKHTQSRQIVDKIVISEKDGELVVLSYK